VRVREGLDKGLVGIAPYFMDRELMDIIRAAGKQLVTGRPGELVVGNMVSRILRLIREAYVECARDEGSTEEAERLDPILSLHHMLTAPEEGVRFRTVFRSFKGKLMSGITDLLEELKESADNIAQQAMEHIHTGEIVMTLGYSSTVAGFLKKAGDERDFHVIVAEAAPNLQGHRMARELAEHGIETTLITDAAIYAVMSRVNKVIIGTRAVMADGGLMAASGTNALCLAAKHHSVPVLVCTAMFKLCPRYLCSYDQDAFNSLGNPTAVAPYSRKEFVAKARVVNPLYDYVTPDLVTLFISNIGGNAPSYVYRLLSEYYHEEDYVS